MCGGITVLNQAVLLRGINDDIEAQVALSERLIDLGVLRTICISSIGWRGRPILRWNGNGGWRSSRR